VSLRDQVDRFRRAPNENDLPCLRGVQEALHFDSSLLKLFSRPLAEQVDAAMNIGVVCLVITDQCVDDNLRLLRTGGVVEVDEQLAVDFLAQDWKILTDALYIKRCTRRGAAW